LYQKSSGQVRLLDKLIEVISIPAKFILFHFGIALCPFIVSYEGEHGDSRLTTTLQQEKIMSHEITFRDIQLGLSMAWHRLTSIVEKIDRESAEPMLYPMDTVPLVAKVPMIVGDASEIVETTVNSKQIVSLDDGLPIGKPVGIDYKLLSNVDIWEAMENALVGTKYKIVSAGTVRERSLAYISIEFADSIEDSKGNKTKPLFNLQWGHGGNMPVVGIDSCIKIVCANTYRMSLKGGFALKMKHTKNASALELSEAIDNHIGVAKDFELAMKKAESIEVDTVTAREVFAGFHQRGKAIPQEYSKTGGTRLANYVDRLETLFHYGAGNAGQTRYDMFNSATDFYSHESSGGDDSDKSRMKQFTSSEFGSGATLKGEFFNVIDRDDKFEETRQHGEKALLALN
tara:strand:+ start:173 stop:1375 length:1203 start_codon:yes stop_codon:yes gene_type:complete